MYQSYASRRRTFLVLACSLVLFLGMVVGALSAPVSPDLHPGVGGPVPPVERNHTQYSTVWLNTTGSVAWFADFYVSAGAQHGIQQTGVPDNKRCLHRIYHRATGVRIVSVWLWGNDYNYDASYFTFGNNSSTSQAFEHSVTGCSGQVQVYYWH